MPKITKEPIVKKCPPAMAYGYGINNYADSLEIFFPEILYHKAKLSDKTKEESNKNNAKKKNSLR